ncbi:MAG: LysR substrate-binding domain-containing protein [Acidimicrobiia bacterium]|nr:LysR substrate-binding domain-containing protein [Acidimicrobiia bacterium]
MSHPTLRQLEYAVALADHLHFGEAAAAVNVTQPGLSTQIRELERRLGVALFERGISGTSLTAAGEEVVARARTILGAVAGLEMVAAAHQGGILGSLRIAAIPTIAPYFLPVIVDGIQAEWPDAHVVIEELQTKAMVDAIESGDLDVGVLAVPYETGNLHVEPLCDEPFRLAVRDDHHLAQGESTIPLDVLTDLHVLLLPEGHCLRDHARHACEIAGRAEHSEVRASSIGTLARMVASGMGATLLPASAEPVEARAGSGISTRRFEQPAPGRTIALVWRPSDPRADLYASAVPTLRAGAEGLVGE